MDEAQEAIQSLAVNAAEANKPMSGVGETPPTTGGQLVTLPMTEVEFAEWELRIKRARARITSREKKWDTLLKEYLPTVEPSGTAESVKVNAHFRNVHTKLGQLFFRSPDLQLTPEGPANDAVPDPTNPAIMLRAEDVVSIKQAVLNKKLGRDGIKANRLMDELIFDVLAWAGVGVSKLGYRAVIKQIPKPVMQPDPNFIAPQSILGLSPAAQPPMVPVIDPATGQPKTQLEPVAIFEEQYWRRFSPKKWLCNDDLRSGRYDEEATWMGMEFFMTPEQAMRTFGLSEEDVAKAVEDDRIYKHEDDTSKDSKAPGLVRGVEIWPKASMFTDQEHPLAINQLTIIDGMKRPVVWRPSPDQTFDELGKLTPDSLVGFPIRVLTVRDLADSAFPEADSAFTNSIVKQLNTFRRQSVKLRDAAIGKYFYDQGAFDETEVEILKNGETGEFVGVAEGKLAQGADKILTTMKQLTATHDDSRSAQALKQDMDETLGINSTVAGAETDTVRSATEIASITSAVAGRNEKEQSRVMDFYIDGARMVDTLIMRYQSQQEWVQIAGEDGSRRLAMWNKKVVFGKYSYDIAPDSQLRVDTARDRQQNLSFYNLTAKDPLVNRAVILRRLARQFGYDPAKIIIDPMAMMTQPPHGGAANKHEAGKSGGRPNEPGAVNHRDEQNNE